jgi:leucyl/phenylalanyl-tRNA---protein transferase
MTIEAQSFAAPSPGETPRQLRATLFRETLPEKERWSLGALWALRPHRIGGLAPLGRMWLSESLAPSTGLPDPERALASPPGLCGFVHELSSPTLLEAYRRGLFTFAHFGPLKWYSPPERCVLAFEDMHLGKNLRRLLRQDRYRVTFDRDFEHVIAACAGRRQGKWHVTWITPRIMRAYAELHDAGHVHSFEVWNQSGELVGGGYGLAIGGAFFTESQFSRERDTSKLGFAVLNAHLSRWGFLFNDGKWATPTLCEAGFTTIPRAEFRSRLGRAVALPGKPGSWQLEVAPAEVAKLATKSQDTDAPCEHDKAASQSSSPRVISGRAKRTGASILIPALEVADGEILGCSIAALGLLG